MKLLYILLLLGLQTAAQPSAKTNWDKEMLKGRVKYIKSTRYILPQAEKDLASIKPNNYDIDSFNDKGYRIKTYHVDSGKVTWMIAYDYNPKNQLMTKLQAGKEITSIVYTYDTVLKRITQMNYKADGSVGSKAYFTYDKYGNITEQRSIGIVNNKCVMENDSSGKLIQMFCFGTDENLDNKYVFIYDANARKISAANYDATGRLLDKTMYQYDMNDNETEMRALDSNLLPTEIVKTFYQYDILGNWTTMVKTDDMGTVKTTEKREIVYY